MPYPVRLHVDVIIPGREGRLLQIVQRGQLIAEPRVGGEIQIPTTEEDAELRIKSVYENVDLKLLVVRCEDVDYTDIAPHLSPNEVVVLIEQTLSKRGWIECKEMS